MLEVSVNRWCLVEVPSVLTNLSSYSGFFEHLLSGTSCLFTLADARLAGAKLS